MLENGKKEFINEGFTLEEENETPKPSNGHISSNVFVPSPTPPKNGLPPSPNPPQTVLPSSMYPHEDEGGGCGWLELRPRWLQGFRTSNWVLFGMCWAGAIQGMVINGFINVCITTIEKRFSLKSSTAGIIAGTYDIGAVLCSIPVSYLGSLPGASKPRWIGWGILIMGLGSFVFALPHFLAPYYELKGGGGDPTAAMLLCLTETPHNSSSCSATSAEWISNFQYVFFAGQFLHGVGASPLYTLGVAYLDESVPVKMSSLYLGIFHGMAVVGPAAGYVIGGQLLTNLYVDVPYVEPESLGITREDNDKWIGAWWVGFLISGLAAISLSWILIAFPAQIPGASKRAKERLCEASHISAKAFEHIRHLPGATKVLLQNLPFVFLCLAEASDGVVISGFSTFMPKVIENQFGMSAGMAGLIVGSLVVSAGGGGTFLGGWLVKHFKLGCEGILKFCFLLSAASFAFTFTFLMACPEAAFAGVNVEYANRSSSLVSPSLLAECNVDCNCEETRFDPVCGEDNVMYYSSCHAGCQAGERREDKKIYSDCRCIESISTNQSIPLDLGSQLDPVTDQTNQSILLEMGTTLDPMTEWTSPHPPFSATSHRCPSTCSLLPPFLLLFFIVILLTFLISMPSMAGTLRCVPDTHRSLALGLQGIQIRVLGMIPGPIIFGIAMDRACALWHGGTCSDGTGACRHYSNSQMSLYLTGVSLLFKAGATILYFLSWWVFRRKRKKISIQNSSSRLSVVSETLHSEMGSAYME